MKDDHDGSMNKDDCLRSFIAPSFASFDDVSHPPIIRYPAGAWGRIPFLRFLVDVTTNNGNKGEHEKYSFYSL